MNLFACSVECVRLVGAQARKREGDGTAQPFRQLKAAACLLLKRTHYSHLGF